jgi:abortive infection bacteriophage resistance protein
MSTYAKRHLTFAQQVDLLRQRGLHVDDARSAAAALERFGYYRLAGYWVPFRDATTGLFREGAAFVDVLRLYEYDKALRLLILSGLERIEIALRVQIAHLLGQKDAFALERPNLFDQRFAHSAYATWYLRYQDSIDRTTDHFVRQFLFQYGHPLPVWLGIELWDFGMLSRIYEGMRFKDRDEIAMRTGAHNGKVLRSWLHSMSVTRNICAHHGRYWNRTLAKPVSLPPQNSVPQLAHLHRLSSVDARRQYVILSCISYMLNQIDPESSWRSMMVHHLSVFPKVGKVSLSDMGFPPNWNSEEIWRVS